MVSLFEEQYKKSVLDIWSKAFHDSEEFINRFLDFSGAETYVYRENGEVFGMFSVFNVEAHGKKGGYIYALAVEEKHRRKSIASKMLEFADGMFLGKGYAFSIVVPELCPHLEAFYKKRGFENEIGLCADEIYPKDCRVDFKVQTADSADYFSARNMNADVLKHDEKFYKFLCDDMLNDGAEVLKISVCEQNVFCVCYCKDGYAIIREAVGKIDRLLLSHIISQKYGVEKVIYLSQEGFKRYQYALLKKYDNDFDCNIYVNLLLDSFELRF